MTKLPSTRKAQFPRNRTARKPKPALMRLALSSFIALSATTLAQAHAHLVKATPTPGSIVHAMPGSVELSFSEAVEQAFSRIDVTDSKGRDLDAGKPVADARDPKILRVSIKLTAPGVYKVHWRVVSVDPHRSSGEFAFTVAP